MFMLLHHEIVQHFEKYALSLSCKEYVMQNLLIYNKYKTKCSLAIRKLYEIFPNVLSNSYNTHDLHSKPHF